MKHIKTLIKHIKMLISLLSKVYTKKRIGCFSNQWKQKANSISDGPLIGIRGISFIQASI